MGLRMRDMDWSRTALGPVEDWPQSLRSTVSMMLPSKAQIILFWGPEFVVLYNVAYRSVFGAKHPEALGLAGRDAWREIWESQLHTPLAGVVRTGEASGVICGSRSSAMTGRDVFRRVLRSRAGGIRRGRGVIAS
jgi:hypothetical protein